MIYFMLFFMLNAGTVGVSGVQFHNSVVQV